MVSNFFVYGSLIDCVMVHLCGLIFIRVCKLQHMLMS